LLKLLHKLLRWDAKISDAERNRLRLLWNIMLDFKRLFLAFILILLTSILVYVISYFYPEFNEVLKVSTTTPWGIVTSVFAHGGFMHLRDNMLGLCFFFIIFFITNFFPSKEERESRVTFFLVIIFAAAIVSNIAWIIIAPQRGAIGSSGLVYASQGIVTGFALSNGLRIFQLSHDVKKKRPLYIAVYVFNLVVFLSLCIPIFLDAKAFLNVAENVNSVVHGIAFLVGLFLTTIWAWVRQVINSSSTLQTRVHGKPSNMT